MTASAGRRVPPRRLVVAAVVIVVAAGLGAAWAAWGRSADRAGRALTEARRLRSAGDDRAAEEAAAGALKLDPTLGEAGLLAAECAASQGEYERAVGYAERVTAGSPRVRLRAASLAARWSHHRLSRLGDAERAYRAVLAIAPDDVAANTELAALLGLCGRRAEAVPFALRVIRRGEPTDLLALLARESGAVDDPDLLAAARRADPNDVNPLLGLAWRAGATDRAGEAIGLLREATKLDPDSAAARMALGRQLVDAGRLDDAARWCATLRPADDVHAEAWVVRGRLAEDQGDPRGAVRCFWEASRRVPELRAPNLRLASLLAEANDPAADKFAEQARRSQELVEALDRALFSSGGDGIAAMLDLTHRLEGAGRLWEAFGWSVMAAAQSGGRADAAGRAAELRRRVEGLPLRQTIDEANVALSLNYSRDPIPDVSRRESSRRDTPPPAATAISFREDGAALGLKFRYLNGSRGASGHRMFEFTGGGVAALDYDLDGRPDVFYTQGSDRPPGTAGNTEADRLFRNAGERFRQVEAGIVEADFGQGATVGDFDADGFPDLYVANIGPNRLWKNNGDGTFSDATASASLAGDDWTTSCLMADLDGDGLPDLYDVNYVTGADVFERVCAMPDGSPTMCMPYDFEGQPDRLRLNGGDGTFRDVSSASLPADKGKGLGVVAWSVPGGNGLGVLVANDTTPNQFLRTEGSDGTFRLRDLAIEAGLAFNGDGKATGCMGVAVGDVDDDGRQDLYITNFLAEPNTLYTSSAGGLYEDDTREYGLREASAGTLGFGTQFLDADLDGGLELFVANGHIDDLRAAGKPYEMPAQLFRRAGVPFQELAASGLGAYFEGRWLGRAAARIDWNRDGREDLAVGHLGTDSALLTNTTVAGNPLSLRLVGVRGSRDAIGAEVLVRTAGRTVVRQLTAGDGYQASNERRVVVGLGGAEKADELVVRWPDGTEQAFSHVVPGRYWLRDGGRPLPEAP